MTDVHRELQKLKALINQRQTTAIFSNKSNESTRLALGDVELYINDMTRKFSFTAAGIKNPVMIDPKRKSIENLELLNGLKVEEIITGIEDIEELQEITAEHTERIGVIEGDVAALKNHTQELETRTDELTTRSDALETRSDALETRAQQLETKTDELYTRTGIIEIQTQELDSRTDELETRSDALETRAQQLETQTQELDTHTQQLDGRTQELDTRTDEIDTHTQQLDTRTDVLEGQVSDLAAAVDNLEKSMVESSPLWDDVREKPTTFPPSEHTHDYASSSHNHDDTYSKLGHTHDIYASSSRVDRLERDVDNLEDRLLASTIINGVLNTANAAANVANAAKLTANSALDTAQSAHSAANSAMEAVGLMEDSLDDLTHSVSDLSGAMDDMTDSVDLLSDSLESISDNMDAVTQQVNNVTETVQDAQEGVTRLHENYNQLDVWRNRISTEFNNCVNSLNEAWTLIKTSNWITPAVLGTTIAGLSTTYAAVLHNHDEEYAHILHDHDDKYAAIEHTHNDTYAAIEHTHDYTNTDLEIGALYSKGRILIGPNGPVTNPRFMIRMYHKWSNGYDMNDPYTSFSMWNDGEGRGGAAMTLYQSGKTTFNGNVEVGGNVTIGGTLNGLTVVNGLTVSSGRITTYQQADIRECIQLTSSGSGSSGGSALIRYNYNSGDIPNSYLSLGTYGNEGRVRVYHDNKVEVTGDLTVNGKITTSGHAEIRNLKLRDESGTGQFLNFYQDNGKLIVRRHAADETITSQVTLWNGTDTTLTRTFDRVNINDSVWFKNSTVSNDYARIQLAGTTINAGELEIATADDATEPIYVRQYTGQFQTLTRTLTLLDGSGNTTLPGNLTVSGECQLSALKINCENTTSYSLTRNLLTIQYLNNARCGFQIGGTGTTSPAYRIQVLNSGTDDATLNIGWLKKSTADIMTLSQTAATIHVPLTCQDTLTCQGTLKVDRLEAATTSDGKKIMVDADWLEGMQHVVLQINRFDNRLILFIENNAFKVGLTDSNAKWIKGATLFNGSQTVTHRTNSYGELGTFCESTGKIYDGYDKITNTDCICQVQQAKSLNKKIVGIVCSEDEFASHGDVYVRVADASNLEVGDILCPDANGYGRKATEADLMYMMMYAIPRPKITSLDTAFEGFVACFLV